MCPNVCHMSHAPTLPCLLKTNIKHNTEFSLGSELLSVKMWQFLFLWYFVNLVQLWSERTGWAVTWNVRRRLYLSEIISFARFFGSKTTYSYTNCQRNRKFRIPLVRLQREPWAKSKMLLTASLAWRKLFTVMVRKTYYSKMIYYTISHRRLV